MTARFDAWLTATEPEAVRAAWTALSPTLHRSPHPLRKFTMQGAALLAQAMLGTRPDWIAESWIQRPPTHAFHAPSDAGCFVENAWDMSRCDVDWKLWEEPGLQVLQVGCGTLEGRPEGGSNTVVRIYKDDRAVSILVDGDQVSTIGDVDLTPLDVLSFSQYFTITEGDETDVLRGLLAQLTSELDAHYDTSASWPADATDHFTDGERSVAIDRSSRTNARTELRWGHTLAVERGYVWGRLPDADIDRVIARLATITRLR